MLNIELAVYKVASKSAEVGYDPATGTNWCHLPMEMRERCIGKMDFKTRIRMSATSHTEKSLVAAKKYDFDRVSLIFSDCGVIITARQKYFRKDCVEVQLDENEDHDERVQCTAAILKTSDIKSFNMNDYKDVSKLIDDGKTPKQRKAHLANIRGMKNVALKELSKFTPFSFKKLTLRGEDVSTMQFFLENCAHLERITFQEIDDSKFRLGNIILIPSIVNVSDLRFTKSTVIVPLWNLVKKWIEMDAEVGKSLQFMSHRFETIDSFTSKFKSRIIERKAKELVRIRMNNKSKQIVLVVIASQNFLHSFHDYYILCKVAPIDLPESEYKTGGEWIENVYNMNDGSHYPPIQYMDSDESEFPESSESERSDISDEESDY